jgi:hypothetical protein
MTGTTLPGWRPEIGLGTDRRTEAIDQSIEHFSSPLSAGVPREIGRERDTAETAE